MGVNFVLFKIECNILECFLFEIISRFWPCHRHGLSVTPHVSVGWDQYRRNKRARGTRSHKVGKGKRVPPARYVTDGLALPHIACGVTENSSLREQRQEILLILGILRKLSQRLTMLFDDHAVAHEGWV